MPIPSALSITSPLQGAVYTVEPLHQTSRQAIRDGEGFSQLFRLTLYTCRLLSTTKLAIPANAAGSLRQYLPEALHYVNEKLTLESANNIWIDSTTEILDEAADILSEGRDLIQQLLNEPTETDYLANTSNQGWGGYHSGLLLADIVLSCVDHDGPSKMLTWWGNVLESHPDKNLSKSENLVLSAAIAKGLREPLMTSKWGKRLLNELVSDATDLGSIQGSTASLRPLVLLNIFLAEDSEPLDGVQPQRIVFLLHTLIRLLNPDPASWPIISETLKLLTALLPAVQGIYGEHWQQILDFLLALWDKDLHLQDDLPVLHSSLRLYLKLKTLTASEDANEDLLDAWKDINVRLEDNLLKCLQLFEHSSEGTNQPRQITAALLGRSLATVEVKDVKPLYRLMLLQEDGVLGAAYGLLHRKIPQQQESLSLELVLEKSRS